MVKSDASVPTELTTLVNAVKEITGTAEEMEIHHIFFYPMLEVVLYSKVFLRLFPLDAIRKKLIDGKDSIWCHMEAEKDGIIFSTAVKVSE